jgi:hypothetical protein
VQKVLGQLFSGVHGAVSGIKSGTGGATGATGATGSSGDTQQLLNYLLGP